MSARAVQKERVAVIGGGLGGLAAALAFRRMGAEVHVHERAPEFGEVGAGIQVASNGLRVLRALGVDPGDAFLGQGTTLHDHRGTRVAILPNGPGREVRLFHRADLLKLLEEACRAAGVKVHLGHPVTPEDAPEADLLIAADGVNSAFRRHVAPDLADPAFSGQAAWRAIVVPPEPIREAGVSVYMGPGAHVVVYPMRGGELINLVAGEDTPEPQAEGWRAEVPQSELAARLSVFGGPIAALIERAEKVHRWGLYHHALPRRWSAGRVVLLGDSVHAMLPYLAQGACMALEDAMVLARCWERHDDADAALGAYERIRAPRVARVMKEVRANATRFHHSNAVARFIGHGALRTVSTLAPGLVARRFDWLYNYDATRV
ncbi:MAG: FAD-dependent monooxygenase [Pseudomonadota bacterium]